MERKFVRSGVGESRRAPSAEPLASRLGGRAVRWHAWLVGIICLAPFAGLLMPDGRVLPNGRGYDFLTYQLPIREYAVDQLSQLRFPLWISYLGAGLPLHAGQQASLLHPVASPLTLLFGARYGLKLCLFLHLALAYIGAYFLARFHNISRGASAMAGVVTIWSGFCVQHLVAGHVALIIEYAVVPWLFLSLAVALRRPGPASAAALATAATWMALAGHPQVFYYALLFGAFWAAGSIAIGVSRAARARCALWGMLAVIIAFMMSAAQLIPAFELARDGMGQSYRAERGFPSEMSLTGIEILGLIAPEIMGNDMVAPLGVPAGAFQHERLLYMGLGAPMLALCALSRRTASNWQWGAALLVLLSVAVSLGDRTPLFAMLLRIVPGLGQFRAPGRIFGAVTVLAALLAGRGLDALVRREAVSRGGRRRALVGTIIVMLSIVGWALLHNAQSLNWHAYLAFANRYLSVYALATAALAVDVLAVLLFAWQLGRKCRTAAYLLAILLTLADLGWNNVSHFRLAAPRRVSIAPVADPQHPPERFVQAPATLRVGIEQLRYSGLVAAAIESRRQLLGTNEGGVLPASTERLFLAIASNPLPALAVASCGQACSPLDGHCKAIAGSLPRVRLFALSDRALVQQPIGLVRGDDIRRMRERIIGTARIVSELPERIIIDEEAPVPSRLVLADTWFPGWQATVDGSEVEIGRAHGVFRAVDIPAGPHRVTFSYRPLSFRVGLISSACGLALWCGILALALHRWASRP